MRLDGYKRTVVDANDRKTAVNQRAKGEVIIIITVHSLLLLSIITFLVVLFSLSSFWVLYVIYFHKTSPVSIYDGL